MANSRTLSYDALVTTTLDNLHKSGKLTDLVQNSNPTFAWLKAHSRTSVDGGHQVRIPVMTGLADNVDSMSPWGDINLTPQEGITTYFDNWAIYSGAVTITGHEERTNRGKAAITSLIKEKVYQLTGAFAERMNNDLWHLGVASTSANQADTTGNGDLNIKSIPIIVPAYTSATAVRDINYLGIDATYWKPKYLDYASATATAQQFINLLRTLWLDCSKKQGGSPDFAVGDYTSYGLYQNALDTKVRYMDTKMADMGFVNVKLEGATFFPDVYVPDADNALQSAAEGASPTDGTIYLLNSKTFSLKTMAGADFQPGVYEKIQGKDAKACPYIWEGQLVCDNPQKNGVAFALPTVTTA